LGRDRLATTEIYLNLSPEHVIKEFMDSGDGWVIRRPRSIVSFFSNGQKLLAGKAESHRGYIPPQLRNTLLMPRQLGRLMGDLLALALQGAPVAVQFSPPPQSTE